jgi:hypothetical protein
MQAPARQEAPQPAIEMVDTPARARAALPAPPHMQPQATVGEYPSSTHKSDAADPRAVHIHHSLDNIRHKQLSQLRHHPRLKRLTLWCQRNRPRHSAAGLPRLASRQGHDHDQQPGHNTEREKGEADQRLRHDHQKQARLGMAGLCTAVSAGTAGSINDSGWLETAITPTKPASAANAETEPLEFATPTPVV